QRWLARQDGAPLWMIRVEERKVLGGKIAWSPRGPTARTVDLTLSVPPGFEKQLKAEGFSLLIMDPWIRVGESLTVDVRGGARRLPQTIWLDLSVGADAVYANFHTQMRKCVQRAKRGGIRVETTCDPERIVEFIALCKSVSQKKGFELRATSAFIDTLLRASKTSNGAEAAQFVSLKGDMLASGLFVIR